LPSYPWLRRLDRDLDFGAILAVTRGEKPSLVQIRNQDVAVERLGQTVVAALRLLVGELERVLYSRLKRTGPACACRRFVRLPEYIQKAASMRNLSAKIFCD